MQPIIFSAHTYIKTHANISDTAIRLFLYTYVVHQIPYIQWWLRHNNKYTLNTTCWCPFMCDCLLVALLMIHHSNLHPCVRIRTFFWWIERFPPLSKVGFVFVCVHVYSAQHSWVVRISSKTVLIRVRLVGLIVFFFTVLCDRVLISYDIYYVILRVSHCSQISNVRCSSKNHPKSLTIWLAISTHVDEKTTQTLCSKIKFAFMLQSIINTGSLKRFFRVFVVIISFARITLHTHYKNYITLLRAPQYLKSN